MIPLSQPDITKKERKAVLGYYNAIAMFCRIYYNTIVIYNSDGNH